MWLFFFTPHIPEQHNTVHSTLNQVNLRLSMCTGYLGVCKPVLKVLKDSDEATGNQQEPRARELAWCWQWMWLLWVLLWVDSRAELEWLNRGAILYNLESGMMGKMGFISSKILTPVSTPTQLNTLNFRKHLHVALLVTIMFLQLVFKKKKISLGWTELVNYIGPP